VARHIAEEVAATYRAGTIDKLDVVRRYAVVLDWKDGALLPTSTEHSATCSASARPPNGLKAATPAPCDAIQCGHENRPP